MTLSEVRKEIDGIDDELLRLFCRRMDCAKEVARIKAQEHLPVLNPKREQEILEAVGGAAGEYGGAARILFSTMMDVSRALQHDLLCGGEALRGLMQSAGPLPAQPAGGVACPGVEGSFSGEAAWRLFPARSPKFYTTFQEVCDAVTAGEAEFGVLPVENSSAGSVTEVYDLLLRHRFYIVGAADLRVRHVLAAPKGACLAGVRQVYSHPQALRQCAGFLQRHAFDAVPYSNTAVAAEMVSRLPAQSGCAAICSRRAAEQYGLEFLAGDIQDQGDNCTRFLAVSRTLYIPQDADKISLCFALPHTTGSLYRTLARFALHGLNLTKIESRPMEGGSFEYFFYLDFSGSVRSEAVQSLVCALSEELPQFSFLGNYREMES